jgi:hypothetical protein
LYQTYNNNNEKNKNLKKYFDHFNKYKFDIYIVINNEDSFNETIKNNLDTQFIFIKGDNSLYEFSGYNAGVNYMINSNKINHYEAFIITNETINKNQPIFLNDIIPETFDYAVNNNCCIGHIDSHDYNSYFTIENMVFNKWIRANFLLFNKNIFKKISNKIIYINNETDIINIKIDENTKNKITDWIYFNKRYETKNSQQKNIKFINIVNEFILSYNINQYCDLIELKDIKKYSYNFFDSNYNLSFNKIPFENNWYDINKFLEEKRKLYNIV